MSEQFTMPRKLAHELLGALFNGPGLNPAGYEALKQDFAARMRAAPAPAAAVVDLLAPQPLTEPVDIAKALLAHREARAVLSAWPRAAVHLVNISLTGWAHTEDTATAFADGYNLALKQLRAALLAAATTERN